METAIIGHSFHDIPKFGSITTQNFALFHAKLQEKLLRNLEEKSVSDPLCLDEVVVTVAV
jgi:hypothetical protein